MNQTRGFLFILLAMFSFLIFQAWTQDEQAKIAAANAPKTVVHNAVVQSNPEYNLVLDNGYIHLSVNTLTGNLVNADLNKYFVTTENKVQLPLLSATQNNFLQISNGLTAEGREIPVRYSVVSKTDSSVTLKYTTPDNISYTKTISLVPNSYQVKVSYSVDNNSKSTLKNIAPFSTFINREPEATSLFSKQNVYGTNSSYAGVVTSTSEDNYDKVSYSKIADNDFKPLTSKTGWVAISQHFFVSAYIPEQNNPFTIATLYQPTTKDYFVVVTSQGKDIAPSASVSFANKYWIGPKLQDQLKAVAPNLNLVVDYGWAFFLAAPLFWLLSHIHDFFSNWGVCIIILVIIVRIIISPLSRIQFRSQALMRVLAPEVAAAAEKAGEDKMKRMLETQNVYKRYGTSQFVGCLPALIQAPIFFALFYMINEAVELRHSPFIWWIHDLSQADPYYILPIINGILMIYMFSLTPMPDNMDPMQKKIMKSMPYIFLVFFLFLPSGLILYYIISNIITIGFIKFYMHRISYQYKHKLLKTYTVKANKTYERLTEMQEQARARQEKLKAAKAASKKK